MLARNATAPWLRDAECDGSFTYTPDPGFYGQDGFSYHLSAGTNVSNTATVTLQVTDPNMLDLAGGMDFTAMQCFTTDPSYVGVWNGIPMCLPPPNWYTSVVSTPDLNCWDWYGWGIYTDTHPSPAFNIMSTVYTGGPWGWGGDYSTDPVNVATNFFLPCSQPITGWGLSMQMDVNNVDNCTLPAGHVAAEPVSHPGRWQRQPAR